MVLPTPPPVALIDDYWAPTLAFAGSLGRRGVPLQVYGAGAARHSRYATSRSPCPPVTYADEFLPWLGERVRSGDINRLAPTNDLIAYYSSTLREEFPPEVRRSIPPLSEIENALLKTRFSVACRNAGFGVPLATAPDDPERAVEAAREIGYPIMLKPKSHLVVGSENRGHLVDNEEALRRHYQRYAVAPGQDRLARLYPELRWPVLQRYVPAAKHRVYSVSGIKDADSGIVSAILSCKRAQWPPDVGVSILQESCDDPRILREGLAIVDRLVSRGIFELELIADGTRLLAIDLNPRAFGFIKLDIALGSDLPWLWFESTRRVLAPVVAAPEPRSPVECRFAVPYFIARSVAWVLGGDFPRPSQRDGKQPPWVSMLGDLGDPLPLCIANLRLLRHPGSLVRPHLRAARSGKT
jgi:predicted ATP-grasp superfamily ATP-dependent carboligase